MVEIALRGARLLDDIARTRTEPGRVAFWWLGQHSFILKGGETVIYIDPFLSPHAARQTPPLLAPEDVTNADLVLGTHDHLDHIDPGTIPGIAAASPNARFVVPRTAADRVRELGVPPERLLPLTDGERAHSPGFQPGGSGARVTAIKSKHERFDEVPGVGFPFLGYVVELNGATIYHPGDTIVYEGLVSTLRRQRPSVAFLPINGRDAERLKSGCIGNMTYQEAVDLAGDVGVRWAIPTHYDMFIGNQEDPTKFVRYLEVKFPEIHTWVGPAGQRVVVP
jgi:L-ascorbate metabolism protein UlaG (beta-lactamase superfamily)